MVEVVEVVKVATSRDGGTIVVDVAVRERSTRRRAAEAGGRAALGFSMRLRAKTATEVVEDTDVAEVVTVLEVVELFEVVEAVGVVEVVMSRGGGAIVVDVAVRERSTRRRAAEAGRRVALVFSMRLGANAAT